MKLLCFPYAGGSSSVYLKWKAMLHKSIELVPVELAGRGERLDEPIYDSFQSAIDDLYIQIVSHIANDSYALFGHSMGGLLVYELYRKVQQHEQRIPSHVFISGKGAPHIRKKTKKLHSLSDGDFRNEIKNLTDVPKELLLNKQLLDIFLPILKSDIKILENYDPPIDIEKFKCSLSVLYGKGDTIALNEIAEWKDYTEKNFKSYGIDGGHFFIDSHPLKVIDYINKSLVYKPI